MTRKKKIAVLGGGTGSMAAVWALTELPDWREHYEITVYQVGWRLGGKGASGRNPDHHQRIEEHGLHVWAGFYENAFRMMQQAYGALDRRTGPIQRWTDAFKKRSDVIVEEHVGGQWRAWQIRYPENPLIPGQGGTVLPTPWEYLVCLLKELVSQFERSPMMDQLGLSEAEHQALWGVMTGGDDHPEVTPQTFSARGFPDDLSGFGVKTLLDVAARFADWLPHDPRAHFMADERRIIRLLERAFARLKEDFQEVLDVNDEARRLYYLLDLGLGTIKGLIMDGVVVRGFDAIDIWDWVDWMRRWGVSDYSLSSVLVRGIFDYIFGYPRGNLSDPRVGAGTAIHGALRLVCTYRGALFYVMQAGMGDIVFAPMYEVLRQRGVKFEFFHKIKNLGLSADKRQIDTITIDVQATVNGGGEYEPLVDVLGVPSWPSYPLYDQLEQGDALRDRQVNLELSWSDWERVSCVNLKRGEGFDEVILGISVAALEHICPELMEANPRFERMVYGIKTNQTQAVQLWIDADAAQLQAPQPPVVGTAYEDPINTWADLSFLIERETWPEDGTKPKFVAYFCGPMDDARPIPGFDDHDFPRRELERVRAMAKDWFSRYIGHIWPGATTQDNPSGLDLTLLHGEGDGEARLAQQYYRANIEPTERYVLSVPGSTALRMKANESGFSNLYLAGDWTYTSIAAGCIECAVMSGLHCAEALSGHVFEIVGRGY